MPDCKHPPRRLFTWFVNDTLCIGCCDCGTVLAGAAEEGTPCKPTSPVSPYPGAQPNTAETFGRIPSPPPPKRFGYYGEALTTELLKSIQADLHTRFDYTDATGKNAKIKILSIKQEGV